MIFSKNRRKLDSKRRFGSREFKANLKSAGSYKRIFNINSRGLGSLLTTKIGRRTLIIFLLIIAFYLFVSHRFLIENIVVSGNVQVSSEQISNAIIKASEDRWFFIPKNHFLLMSKGRVNSLLVSEVPSIKEVTKTNRHIPASIEIEVIERNKGFVLKTNNQSYIIDEEGVVIKQTNQRGDLLLVVNQVNENVGIGDAINPKTTAFIVSMNRQWNSKVAAGISEVRIPGIASFEAQFVSGEGWNVLFDTNRSVLSQLSSLSLLLNQQIKASDRGRLAYIDLRLSKWAYYCFRNTPCSALPQSE